MSITVMNNCNTKHTTKTISVGPVKFFPGINIIKDESNINELRINPGFVRYLKSCVPDSPLKILAITEGSLDPVKPVADIVEEIKKIPELQSKTENSDILTDAINLCEIDGISDKVAESLVNFGIKSIEDVANSTLEILVSVDGIGAKSAPKILESAISLISPAEETTSVEQKEIKPLTDVQLVLQRHSEDDAIQLVKQTMQREILIEWNQSEIRPEVKIAINDQIELLAV